MRSYESAEHLEENGGMVPEAGRREGKDLEAPLRLEIVSALMSALLRAQAAYEDIYQIHRP
ncbi:hypothetical protein ABTL40_19165, partial [Acinetobacter baumannii]